MFLNNILAMQINLSDEYVMLKEVGRMEKVRLNITPKEFKQLSKWSENIYNTAVVILIILWQINQR